VKIQLSIHKTTDLGFPVREKYQLFLSRERKSDKLPASAKNHTESGTAPLYGKKPHRPELQNRRNRQKTTPAAENWNFFCKFYPR